MESDFYRNLCGQKMIVKMNISSITKGPRKSNFELLRIVAMLFVLILHADFFVNQIPTRNDFFGIQYLRLQE